MGPSSQGAKSIVFSTPSLNVTWILYSPRYSARITVGRMSIAPPQSSGPSAPRPTAHAGGCMPLLDRPLTITYDAFRRCRRAMAVRARSAWFTDRDSVNTRATSGSSTTTFVPPANRRAYFPRTSREKSYCFNISGSRLAGLRLFILLPLGLPRPAGADQADPAAPLGMRHNEEASMFLEIVWGLAGSHSRTSPLGRGFRPSASIRFSALATSGRLSASSSLPPHPRNDSLPRRPQGASRWGQRAG